VSTVRAARRLLREIGLDPADYEARVRDAPLEPSVSLSGRQRVPRRSVFLVPRPGRAGRALRHVGGRGLYWTGDPASWTEPQRVLLECCCPRRGISVPVVFETPGAIVVEHVPPDLWTEPILLDLAPVVIMKGAAPAAARFRSRIKEL